MTIRELRNHLKQLDHLTFALPNGKLIPAHFHVTEMGLKTKHYIDCGNTIRQEKLVTFQIWYAQDYEHRLTTKKFEKIIDIAMPLFKDENIAIEVEYQTDLSIGIFDLDFNEGIFFLKSKETTCLASDHCGIPDEKMKISLSSLGKQESSCCSGSSCC